MYFALISLTLVDEHELPVYALLLMSMSYFFAFCVCLLQDLKECVDVSEVVLVCPLLIETALAWTSLSSSPTTTFRALEDFVLCLWSHFNA